MGQINSLIGTLVNLQDESISLSSLHWNSAAESLVENVIVTSFPSTLTTPEILVASHDSPNSKELVT